MHSNREGDDYEFSEKDLLLMEVLRGAEDIYVTDAIEAIIDFRMGEDPRMSSSPVDDNSE